MLAAIVYLVLWLLWGFLGGYAVYRGTDKPVALVGWPLAWVLAGMAGWHLFGAALK